jgi:hypothetical protein
MRQRLRLRRLQLIAALFLLLLAGSTVLAVFHGSTKASIPRQASSVAAIPELLGRRTWWFPERLARRLPHLATEPAARRTVEPEAA